MLSKYSVKKPFTVVVAVVLIIILGFVSYDKMTVDLLPNMNMPYAIVITSYPGASPEEVEQTVTKPVEQVMATVSNIKNVSSTSNENISSVVLEFEQNANMDSVTIEMRENLDQIKGYWPDEVSNPIIMKLNPTMLPVMVSGVAVKDTDAREASRIIQEEVVPEIESVEGVASVTTAGEVEETVHVTVKEAKVSSVDSKVQSQLDQKFKEAESALNDAKKQVEDGQKQLENAASQASEQMTQAESEMAKGDLELSQGMMEIKQKRSELNVTKVALEQSSAVLDSSEESLLEQKKELEELHNNEESIRSQYDAVQQQIQELVAAGEEVPTELLLAQTTLAGQIALLSQYDQTMQTIEEGLAEVASGREQIQKQLAKISEGEAILDATEEQLKSGAMGLAAARAQMSGAQITAALQMSSANAQLSVGAASVQQKEEELKAAKESAKASANVSSMLTANMIQTLLMAQNFDMPAGYVNEDGIDYLVRVGEKFKSLDELKNLVLVDMDGIDPIRLSDIADVEFADNQDEVYAKLNGANGMVLQIQKQTGYSTGDVTDRILEKFDKLQKDNPDLQQVALMNQGVYIDLVVNSVLKNLLFGAVLAILILLLFLKDIRPTVVIAFSIPISIMAAIVMMYFSGVTLNIISLSGLALGVGMLVDNSIVVIENIYRLRNEEHKGAKEAAVEGAKQVAGAIAASTLTTVSVFLPIVFTEGIARQLFVDMALTIGYSLLASLVVALTLVPAMSAGVLKKTDQKDSMILEKTKNLYAKCLQKLLHKKWIVLGSALLLLILSVYFELARGTEFMPSMRSTEVSITLTTPKESLMKETVETADKYLENLQKIDELTDTGAMIGGNSLMGGTNTKTNEVTIYALVKEKRSISDSQLQKKIEKAAKGLDAEVDVSMSNMDMSALGGSGISVQIKGRDLDKLQEIAGDVAGIVEKDKGTKNISDGMEETTDELRVIVEKEKAIAKGLTVAQVYQNLSEKLKSPSSVASLDLDEASFGIVVTEQKNREMTREDIKNLVLDVKKDDGTVASVPLKDIAQFEDGRGLQAIRRDAQSRYITVSAEIKDGDNVTLVSNRIKKELSKYKAPSGYSIEMKGEDQTIRETMVELMKMLGLAIVFMYLIMVAQFQSLKSPFIVMFTVPLAFTGGMLGLMISGSLMSVIAMVGFVMLSGIIVNNGIVFVDYTNQLIEQGEQLEEALILAGTTRLRPIVMTALTTILGLSTMAIGIGSGAEMVRPMAIVTIGGLIYGTLLTLFVVPCIYMIVNRKRSTKERL